MTDTRTKILNAASSLFLEAGVSKMSVRAIAKKAGLSTIGIYSHFQGKQGILDTLYIQGFELIDKAMQTPSISKGTIDSVLLGAKGYIKMACEHEAHYRLIFGEGCEGYEPSDEARAAGEHIFSQLTNTNAEFIKQSELAIDAEQVSMDIWAILHGYVSISHHTRFNESWDWQTMAINAVKIHLGELK